MPVDVRARVVANTRLSPDYNVVALAAPDIAAGCRPGQFVMVKPGRGHDPLLRRPFSVFEILRNPSGIDGFSLLSKRIGVTTSLLYDLEPGDVVECLGPLGRSFDLVDPPRDAWLVAGGVGLAPFAAAAEDLVARGTRTTLFYGARSARELFYLDWFSSRGVEIVTATEDGSHGDRGHVTIPLERALGRARGELTMYACGPEPMLAAVSAVAARHGRTCQVSVERVMGCGMGGCYSCVIPVREDGGPPHYVRSCIHGPVFDGASIVWEYRRAG
ncbi:MAG: dihydroorotate dehydrogenase electron transfer subunit [Acidimicrobiia bacterium]|nr:dihydroorotate dehydrogenase electron transfer subunit [Acidimicrobiia bacterium]